VSSNYNPRRVHLMAGFAPSGRRVRAVCSCGEATTPRSSEARALAALLAEHGTTRAQCALCGRDYQGQSWQQIRDGLVVLDDRLDGEFLACRDMPQSCRDGAAQRQVHLDRAAFDALGIPKPAPVLRVLPGGSATPDRSRP
jgi:hypothetical protein